MARIERVGGINPRRLRKIYLGEGFSDREMFIGQAVEQAMLLREHRAAIHTPFGVGMVTPYRVGMDKYTMYNLVGLAAAFVTKKGSIYVENHLTDVCSPHRENLVDPRNESRCRAYRLVGDEGLVSNGTINAPEDPWTQGHDFFEDIKLAIGNSYKEGIVDTIAQGHSVAQDLDTLGHRFASPYIEHLVGVSLYGNKA